MPTCPVCGYPKLEEPPRAPSGGGSYEICPSCGFQFGVDDDDKGITHEEWRARWMEKGTPWSSCGIEKPKGWDAEAQLASVTKSLRVTTTRRPSAKRVTKATKPVKKAPRKKK